MKRIVEYEAPSDSDLHMIGHTLTGSTNRGKQGRLCPELVALSLSCA
jgi:hypothetical protein